MPVNSWMCYHCKQAMTGNLCTQCNLSKKVTGHVTYAARGETPVVVDTDLPTPFMKVDPDSEVGRRIRQKHRHKIKSLNDMSVALRPENKPWPCMQHNSEGEPCVIARLGGDEKNAEDWVPTYNPAVYAYCRRCQKEPDDPKERAASQDSVRLGDLLR